MGVEMDVIQHIESKRLLRYDHKEMANKGWFHKVTDGSPAGIRKRNILCGLLNEAIERKGLEERDWHEQEY